MFKLLVFLSLYLPFQVALNPSADVDLASIRVLIIGIFFLWLAEAFKNKKIKIKADFQTLFILSFLFWNALSVFVARNPDWSLRKIIFLFSIFPIYFVFSDVLAERSKLLSVCKALVFSGTAAALLGVIQFLMQFLVGLEKTLNFWANYIVVPFLGKSFSEAVLENPSWLVNISGKTYLRAISVFPDPHMFSFYLGILLPLSLGLLIAEKNKVFFAFCFPLLLMADILTFSRGGYLGLMSGAIFLGIFFWYKIKTKQKIAVLAIAGVLVLSLLIPELVSKRFFSSFNPKEGSNQGRIEMWQKSLEVSLDNPWIGVGIGNYPLEVKASANYREPIYAHNIYLDIASETGIINAFIWMGIIIFAFVGFLRKAKEHLIFLMLAASLVIFSVHSFFDTALYSPVVLTLFLIILSFSHVSLEREKNY